MTLIEMYKQKVYETVQTVYNNSLRPEALKKYIDKICENVDENSVTANSRNLYRYEYEQKFNANDMPNIIEKNQLNILANGLYTENFDPPSSDIMKDWMDTRKKLKKFELEALEKGDIAKWREFKNKEVKVKQNTNSMYGASTMPSCYISNVDIGGSITAQARNFISEQQWAIEKFLSSNFIFSNIDELMNWISQLFKIKPNIIDPSLMKYIDYIPTASDCRSRFIEISRDIEGIRKGMAPILKSSFLMFDMMSDERRIFFYYANNPIQLINLNPKIKMMMYDITTNGIEFINPYNIPDSMKDDMNELYELLKYFCFAVIATYDRVVKYQTRKRRLCILSDTDSTMPTMYKLVTDTLHILGRDELVDNELVVTKLVMFYVYVTTGLLDETCVQFAKDCNGYHKDEQFLLKMKNEYFFSRVLIFNVKKNYIGIQKLDEGKVVPEEKQLAITGRSLGSSGLNEYVSESINNIIENNVLRTDNYDPLIVLRGVNDISNHIRESILSGDKTFGIYARFNGINNIKDPERTAAARAGLTWNYIYKDDVISPGDAIYEFDTNLLTEDDLNKISSKYDDIKESIRNNVFRRNDLGFDFSRFGLKLFAIPADGEHVKLPEWIIPFIDIESMISKHLQPITSLYSSLLLSPCKVVDRNSSIKKLRASNLIRF